MTRSVVNEAGMATSFSFSRNKCITIAWNAALSAAPRTHHRHQYKDVGFEIARQLGKADHYSSGDRQTLPCPQPEK